MSECPYCQRSSFLWGGDTCDACDGDSDGVNDRDEPIGIGPATDRTVLGIENKGFEITGVGELQVSVGQWPIHPTFKQYEQYKRVLGVLERRYGTLRLLNDHRANP